MSWLGNIKAEEGTYPKSIQKVLEVLDKAVDDVILLLQTEVQDGTNVVRAWDAMPHTLVKASRAEILKKLGQHLLSEHNR